MTKKTKTPKTKTANANKAERTPKQAEIPGTERQRIAELDDIAETYRELRDKRMKLQQEENDQQAALHEAMKKHKLTKYRYLDEDGDEEEAYVEDKVKVGVRKVRNAKAKDDE